MQFTYSTILALVGVGVIAGTVALVTIISGNLLYGFVAGILLFHLLKLGRAQNAKPVMN